MNEIFPANGRLTLADRAYTHARAAILDGRLSVGQIVSDADLAEELGMSKTPVKQALRLLEEEGLLERGKRRRLVVREWPEEYRDMIVEVRDALGAITVRHACKVLTDDDIDQLRLSLMRQRRAAQAGDDDAFIDLDEDFHLVLTQLAGLPVIVRFLRQIRGYVRVMRGRRKRPKVVLVRIVAEHEAIVDAIDARNEKAAVAAFSKHVRTTEYPGEKLGA